MKIKLFDVIELINGDIAIVVQIYKNVYKVKIINKNKTTENFIKNKDIKSIIFSKYQWR